ncbi:MAG: MerR family transcriptional regulator [Chloroflexota bacterium]
MPEYSLNELAALADVTPRTIRFYIEQGLLPAPASLGPKSRYTDEHLERLLAIKKFQAGHLPLAEIRAQLRGMPNEAVAELAVQSPPPPSQSAVDYIRGVLGDRVAPAPAAQSVPSPAAAAPATTPPQMPQTTEPDRSQWDRVQINPDIELHVRRPLTRGDNKRVSRLIEYARQLFEEDL